MWRGKFLAGERKMFDVLISRYPESISKEELGKETGYEASGGTFSTYLSTLRKNQLATVEKKTDMVKAADTLFELGPVSARV